MNAWERAQRKSRAELEAAENNVRVARLAGGGWEVHKADDGSSVQLSGLEMRSLVRRVREVWAAEYRQVTAAGERS